MNLRCCARPIRHSGDLSCKLREEEHESTRIHTKLHESKKNPLVLDS